MGSDGLNEREGLRMGKLRTHARRGLESYLEVAHASIGAIDAKCTRNFDSCKTTG